MVAGGVVFGENENRFVFKLNPLSKTRMSYMMSVKGGAQPGLGESHCARAVCMCV
jgi:hypothetical protein